MKEFEMKQLGNASKSLGLVINRNKFISVLTLKQTSYVNKLIERFGMKLPTILCQPLGLHFKLSSSHSHKNDLERSEMDLIPYSNAIGSIMYVMMNYAKLGLFHKSVGSQ